MCLMDDTPMNDNGNSGDDNTPFDTLLLAEPGNIDAADVSQNWCTSRRTLQKTPVYMKSADL